MSQQIVIEALNLISRTENVSKNYLLSIFSSKELINLARKINRAREENMDAIRENW